jgi:poly(3-hydroxyoctanoate) depolymerase
VSGASGQGTTRGTDEELREVRIGRRLLRVSDRPGSDSDATPLLLLMGLGGNIGMWEPLRSRLAAGGGMRTVAFDIPGTGGSPVSRVPLPLPLLARLTRQVLDRLGIGPFDVMGLSWGGLLAQHLALTSPWRVRRVVLASTNFGMGSIMGTPTSLRTLFSLERYRSADSFGEAIRSFGGTGPAEDVIAEEHVAARLAHPPSTRGYYYQMLAPLGWSSLATLPLLRQETLLVAGDADTATPAANARIMAALIPRARLHVFTNAGHLVLFQRSAEVADLVNTFLREANAAR